MKILKSKMAASAFFSSFVDCLTKETIKDGGINQLLCFCYRFSQKNKKEKGKNQLKER